MVASARALACANNSPESSVYPYGPEPFVKEINCKFILLSAAYVEKDPDRGRWNIIGVSSIVLEVSKVQENKFGTVIN